MAYITISVRFTYLLTYLFTYSYLLYARLG